jgi:hypothetical protein
MVSLMLASTALVACAPPAAPDVGATGEPAIAIAHPPRDVGTVMLNADGSLEMLVVVDTDNIELTNPYVENIDAVEGQGHWHAQLGNIEGYQASFEPSLMFTVPNDQINPGIVRLTVSLQNNLHSDLDEFENWESSIEFELVPFSEPEDTGAQDTGT